MLSWRIKKVMASWDTVRNTCGLIKSGLTRLPYFDDLLMPHYIDVMHIEKNVAGAHWGTIMETKKSKDNPKLEWTWQSCVIDHTKRCVLLEAARHGKGLRQISS
jgi:hypothetical protein